MAPEFAGIKGVINSDENITLSGLVGKVVLLDFWTSSCVNCLNMIEEVRALEQAFGRELAVVGIHSPKFPFEARPDTISSAVKRNHINHPVLDDSDMAVWDAYGVNAWPTLILIDQTGRIVFRAAGEGHGEQLGSLIRDLLSGASVDPAIDEAPRSVVDTPSYPSKVAAVGDGTILMANAAGSSVLQLDKDYKTVLRKFGSGIRGFTDGTGETAAFGEPSGLCVLPGPEAHVLGVDVVVADRVNHALRGINLSTGEVTTLARNLRSPWDVEWWPAAGVIAIAGMHVILGLDPGSAEIVWIAGGRREGMDDGLGRNATFAQTCGLAAEEGADGRLWLVDSETSSLRFIERVGTGFNVKTVIGKGLFDFGHVDGPSSRSRLQHPQGLAIMGDRSLVIADTYNGALRRFDTDSNLVTTLYAGLHEPTDVLVVDGQVYVLESATSVITHPHLSETGIIQANDVIEVGPTAELEVYLDIPLGRVLDATAEDNGVRLTIRSEPEGMLVRGGGTTQELWRRLSFDSSFEFGLLEISVRAATCDDGGEAPVCYVSSRTWQVAVRVATGIAFKKFSLVFET